MRSTYIAPPYSHCVGVVLINREGLVWVARRAPECARVDAPGCWQMPQGPIATAEPPREAALRMLAGQTGARSVQVLAEAPGWFTYEVPAGLIGVALQGRYCGQKQKWLAARFLGDESEFSGGPREGGKAAVNAWKWVSAADVPRLAPPLKRELCEDVLGTFAPFLAATPREPDWKRALAALSWFVTPRQ